MYTKDEVLEVASRVSNWGRWGEKDERGTLNLVRPEMVLEAASTIVSGERFSLSLPLDASGPQSGWFGRFNPIHLMMRDGGDALSGAYRDWYGGEDMEIRGTDDIIIMPLQCSTQWDALGHVMHRESLYNGFSAAEISSAGAKRLGIENARAGLIGRGVLLDVAAYLGEDSMEAGVAIDSELLRNVEGAQGSPVLEGDIVMIRTGWMGRARTRGFWGDFAAGDAPGMGFDSLEWISERQISALAIDTWGAEVMPHQSERVFAPFHLVAIVYIGLMIGEMFDLEELALSCQADRRYTFFCSAPPLNITGAVGSPVNPIVVR